MSSIKRDSYGGCCTLPLGETGFFRLEKTDRWWLVSPEGNAFLSFGVNHVEPELMMAEYNKKFWAKKFGVDPNSGTEKFLPGFAYKVKNDLKAWGMNTFNFRR